jgi:hypothetical protein
MHLLSIDISYSFAVVDVMLCLAAIQHKGTSESARRRALRNGRVGVVKGAQGRKKVHPTMGTKSHIYFRGDIILVN